MNFVKNWFVYRKNIGLNYRDISILISLSLLSTITEAFGISIFFPIFQYLRFDGDINLLSEQSEIWIYIVDAYKFINIDINLSILLITAFILFFLRQLSLYARANYRAFVAFNLQLKLKQNLFNKYFLVKNSYYDNNPIGSFTNTLTREAVDAVNGTLSPIDIVSFVIMGLVYLLMLFLMTWQVTIFGVMVLALASIIPRIFIKMSEKNSRLQTKNNENLIAYLVNRLKSPILIKLSGINFLEKNNFSLILKKQFRYYFKAAILMNSTQMFLEPIVILLSLFFLYFSVTFLNFSVELIGLYMIVAVRMLPVTKGFLGSVQRLKSNIGAIEIILSRLKNMHLNAEKDKGVESFPSKLTKISFSNVDFKYLTKQNYTLKNINVDFISNKINFLIGPSGSGKSTLIDLIPRLREIDNGKIIFNSKDIKDIKLLNLRKNITYVSQQNNILNISIKDYLKLENKNITEGDILNISKKTGIHDFIDNLESKYETKINDSNTNLSGGQIQKIDITRALINDSKIIILDEPTNNLDVPSSKKLFTLLDKISSLGKIIIVISHSLSFLPKNSNIILIEDGRIVKNSSYEEMLESKNWFSEHISI